MKAGIFFTGTGPILLLTTYESLNDSKLIAYEISEEKIKEQYGLQFKTIMGDLCQTDDLRVLDYDGHHIFNSISFKELGEPVFYEA